MKFDITPHLARHPAKRLGEFQKKNGYNVSVITGIARICYPHLAKPQAARKPGDKEKFGAMFLLPAGEFNAELLRAIADVAAQKFGPQWREKLSAELAESKRIKLPLRRQSELEMEYAEFKGDAAYAQYDAGGTFFRANSMFAPQVVDARELPMDAAAVAAIKSGDYVKCEVTVFAYTPQPGAPNQGVTCQLSKVQYLCAGEKFGSKAGKSQFGSIDIAAFGAEIPQAAEAPLFG